MKKATEPRHDGSGQEIVSKSLLTGLQLPLARQHTDVFLQAFLHFRVILGDLAVAGSLVTGDTGLSPFPSIFPALTSSP